MKLHAAKNETKANPMAPPATMPLMPQTSHFRVERTGNGFVFEHHTPQGLRWAIDEAMRFHIRPVEQRAVHIERIMQESAAEFSPEHTLKQYVEIYELLAGASLYGTCARSQEKI